MNDEIAAMRARVHDSFGRQTVMATLGATLTRVEPGEVDIEMPFRDDLTQQHGFLHAGIVTTLLDSACGYASYSRMPADAAVLAVEFKVNLLSPARGERLIARGRIVKSGRTLSVSHGEAFTLRDGEEKLVAVMQSTTIAILDNPGLAG